MVSSGGAMFEEARRRVGTAVSGCKKGRAVLWQAQSAPQRENRSNSRRAEVSYISAPGNGSSADTAVAQSMGSRHPKRPPND
jgi:hypothetical protein